MSHNWVVDVGLVEDWMQSLDEQSQQQVVAALRMLTIYGPQLGRPIVDTITYSRHKNMKELRPGSRGSTELRILFAFDPTRKAILLVAGDKQGTWSKWYKKNVPIADDRLDMHLEELRRKDE